VVPAFNEGRRIGRTLERIVEYLRDAGAAFEVVVVDDGSRDATADVVRRVAAAEPRVRVIALGANGGKGKAVRRGVLDATGEVVLFSDADLSTPIEEVEKLLEHLGRGASVAIGSRSVRGASIEVHQPWYRELMGKVFNRLVRLLALRGFIDTQCGFKCFTGDAARAIFSLARIDRFAFDVEVLLLAQRLGYRIAEVPIRWADEPNSRVGVMRDSLSMLADLVRIRWNVVRGVYGPRRVLAEPLR
jgi:dolichyl-phosphate beta-glucosyltransferase